jgi:hypothetical protein
MPRQYDYDAGDIGAVQYHGRKLEVRAAGRLEDKEAFFGPPERMAWFYGQYRAAIYDTAFMDRVHAWIDGHATAPWYWYERDTNHGHSVETHVWFSSADDLSAFAAEWDGKAPESGGQGFTFDLESLRMNGSSVLQRRQETAAPFSPRA